MQIKFIARVTGLVIFRATAPEILVSAALWHW